jgi:hypothetical protein
LGPRPGQEERKEYNIMEGKENKTEGYNTGREKIVTQGRKSERFTLKTSNGKDIPLQVWTPGG